MTAPDANDSVNAGATGLVVRPGRVLIALLLVITSIVVAWLQPPNPQPLKPAHQRTVFEWLHYPVEHNAALRLPAPPNALRSVTLAGGSNRAWAGEAGGTILATADGGKTWTAQTSGVQAELRSVHFHAEGQRGWVVGDGSTILATTDGGKTWTAQTSGVPAELSSVHF